MKLVIATHNRHKAGEMSTILSRRFPAIEFVTLADYDGAPEPEETGETYRDNAIIKSESGCRYTKEWCLADDAGLEIDAIPGQLGVWSKRFAGESTSFDEKMSRILKELRDVEDSKRGARFQCFVSLSRPGMDPVVFSATCEGEIAKERSGTGGFGYDSIFWLPQLGCTMADLTAEQKHAVSHRGKVLAAFGDWLESELLTN